MNDEGCPNDPVLSAPKMKEIEGTCDTLGQILDRPECLGLVRSTGTLDRCDHEPVCNRSSTHWPKFESRTNPVVCESM